MPMRHADEINNGEQLVATMGRLSRLLIVPSVKVLADTVLVLHELVSLSDKVLALKSYFNIVQDIQRQDRENYDDDDGKATREECTEDVFMVACSFLRVEIAKQGSFYYLRGESPDASIRKETKIHRNPIDIDDEAVLKEVSAYLSRPDEKRGSVENAQIASAINHLSHLIRLHRMVPRAVDFLKSNESFSKVDVRKQFGLSHTDYEKIMAMARRRGLIELRNRKKDPENNYKLIKEHHELVLEKAKALGCTPNKALNDMITDFQELLKINRVQSTSRFSG